MSNFAPLTSSTSQRALFPSTLENVKINNQLLTHGVHEIWTATLTIMAASPRRTCTPHTRKNVADVLSLSSMTLARTGPQSVSSSMSIGPPVHPGSASTGLALPNPLLNHIQHEACRVLDKVLLGVWVSMTVNTIIKLSWAVAGKEKQRLSVSRSSRTTSTPIMCNLHPSAVADAKRRSASTRGRGTTLDYGQSTNENVRVSKEWR